MRLVPEEFERYRNVIGWQSRFSRFIVHSSRICRETLGVDLTQIRVLEICAHYPMESIGFYCEKLSLRPSTASMALKSLEKYGYAERVPSSKDARSVCVCVTEAGYGLFSQAKKTTRLIAQVIEEDLVPGSYEAIQGKLDSGGIHGFLEKVVNTRIIGFDKACDDLRLELEGDEGYQLYRASLSLECIANLINVLGRVWNDFGLNMCSGRILGHVFLKEERKVDSVGVSELRDVLLMQPAQISAGIMKLENEGLAIRMKGTEDKRTTMISLTRKGRKLALSSLKKNYEKLEELSPGLADVDPSLCYRN